MVTLRAFSSPARAALAKSLLDDHNIICSLADENAYLYGGAPLAMPVRILVADEQAEEAEQILQRAEGRDADIDPATVGGVQVTTEAISQEGFSEQEQQLSRQVPARDTPWEILALACLLSLPGIGLLLQKQDLVLVDSRSYQGGSTTLTVISPATAHIVGALVIAVASALALLFFYTRRLIIRERAAAALLRDQSM